MAIKKHEFYGGAALYLLARKGVIERIRYEAPFFILNDQLSVYLKYSTKGRSPWGFTFTRDEQSLLKSGQSDLKLVIGLVCGSDGVVAFNHEDHLLLVVPPKPAVHIACYRRHGEHYEVIGPEAKLDGKVAPSDWLRILDR